MKRYLITILSLLSLNAYCQELFFLDTADIVFVTRRHDGGDIPDGGQQNSKLVLYKSGLMKYESAMLDQEVVTSISKQKAEAFFLKNGEVFSELQVIRNMGSFPCLGESVMASSGLPVSNYIIGLKNSPYGKEITLPTGELIKQVSFPDFCLSDRNRAQLEKAFSIIKTLLPH